MSFSDALRGTVPAVQPFFGSFGAPTTLDTFPMRYEGFPLSYLVERVPLDLWPLEWLQRQTACGFSFTHLDIELFLSRTTIVPNPKSPHGFCRIWNGARSRGQGNSQWYGSFYTCGKTVRAHKFSAVAILGLRPEPGQHIDHECHNTLCVSCLRVLTKVENEALIRRPKKIHLDLAKFCSLTPADILNMDEDRVHTLTHMMEVSKSLEAGVIPPGVMVDGPRRNWKT